MRIVQAGTVSLLVSIPTVVTGAILDRKLGGIPNGVMGVALWMGIASGVGVLTGAALIPYASTRFADSSDLPCHLTTCFHPGC